MTKTWPNFRWAFPDLPEWRAFIGPVSATETELDLRRWCWNLLWTGVDRPEIPGSHHNQAGLLAHLKAHAGMNAGLGPELSCGTVSEIYTIACAAYKIAARACCATNLTDVADIGAEAYDGEGWFLVLPQCDTHFCTLDGAKLSAMRFAAMEKAGQRGISFNPSSPTGGLPLVRSLAPVYAGWPGFGVSLCVGSGNAHLMSPPGLWAPADIYQINADPQNRPNAYHGKPLPLDAIYAPPVFP